MGHYLLVNTPNKSHKHTTRVYNVRCQSILGCALFRLRDTLSVINTHDHPVQNEVLLTYSR